MKGKVRSKTGSTEREIERALRPGVFISEGASRSFVSALDRLKAVIDNLVATDSSRAVKLCEAFLDGCRAKADEVDDSMGSFGMFMQDLTYSWIKARQAGNADPDQTVATLIGWMDDDPHGFFNEIETKAAAVLDKAGRSAFAKQAEARFAAVSGDPDGSPYKSWSAVLRAIYLAQKNVAAYVEFAKRTGLTPADCLAVGELLAPRKPDDALTWVKRGQALVPHGRLPPTASFGLDKLHRELLTKVGRVDQALELAWAEFQTDPCKYSYQDLMKFVPKAERKEWHEKAMEAAIQAKDADLDSQIELYLELKEMGRLAEVVRSAPDEDLEEMSHYQTEPAAKKLEKTHPELGARLWRAQGMRILNAKKSKYYDEALSNFERARNCYLKAGLAAGWEETVRLVCEEHGRKSGFLGQFQDLAGAKRRVKQAGSS